MSKRASEPVMFLPFFVLMIIIGVGVVLGTSFFYSDRLDTRALESQILMDLVSSCLKEHDVFAAGFTLERCGISSRALNEDFLVYVKRADGNEFFSGVYDFTTQCDLVGLSAKDDAPRCTRLDLKTSHGDYAVTVASRQTSRRGLA